MARWTRVVALVACTGLLAVGAVGLANSASGSVRLSDPNDEKAAAGTSDAFDPGYSEDHVEYLENQVPLIELIEEVARRAPGWGGGTLEGSRIDPLAHTAFLYWHGDTPEQLTKVITDAAADRIALNVVEVSYTQEELSLAVDRIVAAVGGVEGLAIGPAADLGGVEIQYPGLGGPIVIAGFAYDAIDTLRAAADAEHAVSGIPVVIGPGSPISLTGRASDTSPFWGGSVSLTGSS